MADLEQTETLLLDADGFRRIMDARLPFAQMLGMQVDYFASDHILSLIHISEPTRPY